MKWFKYSKLIFFETETDNRQGFDPETQYIFSFLSHADFITTPFFKKECANDYESRFAKGDLCASLLIAGNIVNISWLAKNNLFINELEHSYEIPEKEIMIYDVITKESERGKGYYPLILESIVTWANNNGYKKTIIYSETNNKASISGITKVAFHKKQMISLVKFAGLKFYFNTYTFRTR